MTRGPDPVPRAVVASAPALPAAPAPPPDDGAILITPAAAATLNAPATDADVPPLLPSNAGLTYIVRQDRWSESDEKGYREFIRGIGESNCHTVNSCLKGGGNPFRKSDPASLYFHADCADLPYFLRAYYAWKCGLPFAYEASVAPVGHSRDMRYSISGNEVLERRVVTTGSTTGPALLSAMRDTVTRRCTASIPTASGR